MLIFQRCFIALAVILSILWMKELTSAATMVMLTHRVTLKSLQQSPGIGFQLKACNMNTSTVVIGSFDVRERGEVAVAAFNIVSRRFKSLVDGGLV